MVCVNVDFPVDVDENEVEPVNDDDEPGDDHGQPWICKWCERDEERRLKLEDENAQREQRREDKAARSKSKKDAKAQRRLFEDHEERGITQDEADEAILDDIDLAADTPNAVWKAVVQAWREYPRRSINRVFETLRELIYDKIIEYDGGNGFAIPHFRTEGKDRSYH
mgnify:CR=1 FL=1